ncbi:Divalent-cation tolerance protein CutA [Nitrosotalea devaniterrae]|uniref:Divalent-cation tolerance protein CutA n=1 Tax=Nitrosotalea devaniterrae TaxID=1078905 RepID=A0A128A0S9_9ARCH|nr:Divalent-cation tolerance protein CutA [Candidatus Nitrosotalea devanaterra]
MGIILVSTYPDKKSISRIAHVVVEQKLAACVNYTKINSVYSWKGKIEDAEEFLALFKTTTKSKQKLKEKIAKSHPYDVPEIVELKMDNVSMSYMKWLEESTLGSKPEKRNNASKRRNP